MPFFMFNHPFLFAAVAVVAIGVVVYELIEENKRRQPTGRRRPPGDRPGSPPPGDPGDDRPKPPPGDRPKPSLGDSQRPPSAPGFRNSPSGNNVRRRNINQTSSKERASAKLDKSKTQKASETAVRDAPKTSVENLNKTAPTEGSQTNPDTKFDENNYCKNMLDKLTDDTKNVNKNIEGDILGHNICEEESASPENNLFPKDEKKEINQSATNENICNSKKPYKRKRKAKHNVEKSAKNCIDKKHDNCSDNSDHYETESSSDSQSDNSVIFSSVKVTKKSLQDASKIARNHTSKSQSSNLYPKLDLLSNSESELNESNLSSDEDEDLYKRDMLKALQNDLQNCEIIYNTAACSSEGVEKEKPLESEFCKGCEENRVNTHAYPCNHAYLCVDCAVKVFRVYKKCTICLQDVEEFVQFAI